ncbi:MAG TPA: DUF2459 domain-containing protein [Candidatus Moranbacteria bacterium]|nr:DUF2459 domain-containing protein [Candidatus Moranbacteria bacterium]
MKILQKTLKWFLFFLLIPIGYVIISLILSYITVNKSVLTPKNNKELYLSSNGVHLAVVIQVNDMSNELLKGLKYRPDEEYFSFGWGDENFYLNTPSWDDLTFGSAFKALFLKGSTLIHLARYKQKRKSWVRINVTDTELSKLNQFISASFKRSRNGRKIILKNRGYSINDDFYKAVGRYSLFNTCNTWVNRAFKESGLKACYWTPFAFGLMNKYKK